ncbi:MAG: M23 family metallopeptidase [Gammaproteobacteria bacterium]|nr:M23 family metallopeptidase [Gammaproteobacteria bacterium]MBQ0839416.1 M23 family metallopeptidase [Gammaproteobacteria bacterium]
MSETIARKVQRSLQFLLLCFCAALASPLASALEFQGIWQQGAMLVGHTEPGNTVVFQGRTVSLTPEGSFVIGLGRDVKGPVVVAVGNGKDSEQFSYPVAQREYKIQRVDGVPQRTVTPPSAEVLKRIRHEARLVREARADNDRREDFLQGFIKPLEGPITGVYGSQRVYNGVPKNPHYGLDIARPTGTVVIAPAPGIVKLVYEDMYYSGGTLVLDHGYGLSSTFIHLSGVLVNEGDRVAAGDAIAKVGSTGRATGPHLDWRVNWFGVRLDPALVLAYFPAPH